jgi:NADPH:quinone reductase-like Zn-dependent oxidoreductase
MKQIIPFYMKAVMQDKANGLLYVAKVPVPTPGKNEVLVRMAVSPFNPSDLSYLRGSYVKQPKYPIIPGIEGSGVVVAAGDGFLANLRIGKRVSCSSSEGHGGTWAEYMVTSAMHVIPIKKSISMEQGAMLIVNPMTALAFIQMAKEGKHKTIVNNTAGSVLGRMMIRLCKKEELALINIVRRKEQVETLKQWGAEYVLDSSEAGFEIELKRLTHQLNATLLFDAVAGNQTAKLIEASPYGSRVVIYSNMSEQAFTVEPRSLIQGNKTIESFYLGSWTSKQSLLQTLKAARRVHSLSGKELSSAIQNRFSIEQAQEALEFYTKNMSGGKIVLTLDASLK